ncbi:hypothetical protein KUTeg_000807 [Tegillarca granosa]|uniref:Carboxylic ester hydrolase n=1 Tax=Tegillarca granosa TaxID=220873 RepID=A0ABQ9FZX0_TEGGR|nr:hypothetical protein KUTeg_000807 [Tegillarca granosa]
MEPSYPRIDVKYLFILTLWVILTFSPCEGREEVTVDTIYGPVKGFSIHSHYSAYERKRINVFLGIPYAKRKSQYDDFQREFRFKKPKKPYWGGVWDATYYRPACPQPLWYVKQTVPNFSYKDVDEDCLYLNIFSPQRTDEPSSISPSLYPVMVFIHGGGFVYGAAQQYPGVFLAERNVVVVTFNYRLGPLGFLSTGDGNAIGNYGMWDQYRALEFVRDNIKFFRGNPGVVTLFGSSTGAAAVGLHLLSPRTVSNLPTLADGISDVQFDNILYEFLNDRDVEDLTNTVDALTFQYTYWPQPKNFSMVRQRVIDMMSDYMFGTGMDEVVKAHSRFNHTYVYVFDYFSWNDYLPRYRGIAHGQELQYVFGFPFINETYKDLFGVYPRQYYDYADRNTSEYMIALWTNFSSSGQTEYAFWRQYFPKIWNRPSQFTTPKSAQEAQEVTNFKTATWSLMSVGIILIIIVFALCIAMCRMRPKDY